jgi:signal transduction histidine kinase
MSLRARILALFLVLGVVPILLLGIIGYARSMRAVRHLLEAQTSVIAHQTATDLRERCELRLSELLLLAENAETQRLYRARSGGDSLVLDSALRQAQAYLSDAWARFGDSYRRIELRDAGGRPILVLGGASGTPLGGGMGAQTGDLSPTIRLSVPVTDLERGERFGTLEAFVHLRLVLPGEAVDAAFGRSGYAVVLDREKEEVLHHFSRRFVHQPLSALLGPGSWGVDVRVLAADSGSFRFRESDSSRVASFVSLREPPWTVISTAAVEEFASPFQGSRNRDLLVVLLIAVLVGLAFLATLRRTTASLDSLTEASERVGRGDLDPPLPPVGPDEVGRLSAAFGLMVEQVRRMLRRVEETRQMAVMGEFASSVSHQIRNPLTSIKLNLQGLDEEAERDGMSETAVRSLRICLREVAHMEGAVRKILDLARTHPPERVVTSLHEILSESVELVERQLAAGGVEVGMALSASEDRVSADPEELKSVFVNLLVNAQEAMPGGGSVQIVTDNPADQGLEPWIRVRVRDDGPGVPGHIREQIFRPFVTTKSDGTGFGLAVARLAVQEHRGRIRLETTVREHHGQERLQREMVGDVEQEGEDERSERGSAPETGATFVVELPLHLASWKNGEGQEAPSEAARADDSPGSEGGSP